MAPDFSDIVSVFDKGVRLVVKAKPGSSRAQKPRIVPLAEDKRAVEIAVAAAPEEGKANKALIAFVAQELGLKKRDVDIKRGTSGRMKVVEIGGDTAVLSGQVGEWLKSLSVVD